jgi:type IV pilus assembly protein PilY1
VQQAALNTNIAGATDTLGPDRLQWLRGVQTKEEAQPSGVFRDRSAILGDIINSDPIYVHQDDFGHASMDASEASSYESYVLSKSTRSPVVFVGGNDGMLHAFLADTSTNAGTELFAYVPNEVYANLSKLTAPGYAHQYFVDAGPSVGDAYIDGDWKTVLVGGLGGGGKAIYALDVGNADAPTSSMVKWEYTDTDLGLTYSKPQIARLNNGKWAAVFGNGFNSTSEKAYFYVVDIGTGALIKKIAAGPAVSNNGLSTPVLIDLTGDQIMDYAYVGDLQGNLWKIDLSSSNTADWDVAYSGVPLFTARNDSGDVQPIHAQPVVGSDSDDASTTGTMVYFGTGQYLESDDVGDSTIQTFYGIWDKGAAIATTDRSELQEQSIEAETLEFGQEVRTTTNNSVNWETRLGWYMDFDVSTGERVVSQALLRFDRVVFLTLIPSTEVCDPNGDSWLMELDALTGSRTLVSSFDFSGDGDEADGSFDDADLLASGITASGVKTKVGITKAVTWFTGPDGKDFKVLTGTTGGLQSIGNKGDEDEEDPSGDGTFRRTYWLQIQ